MSVEGGTMSAGGGGPPIGGGVGVSAGSAVGAPGGEFGSTVSIGSAIVNEGPVTPSFLENTMPLTLNRFNPVGEIMFNPEPLSAADAIFEAESIISEAEGGYQTASVLTLEIGLKPIPRPMDFIWIEPKVHPDIQQIQATQIALENAGLSDLSKKVIQLSQPATRIQENPVEQIVEKEKVDQRPILSEREEIEESKLKDILDTEVLEVRIDEFSKATDKADVEREENDSGEIEGKHIVKFLPPEDEGNRSGIVKRMGPDGSRVEAIEEIAGRKFASVKEAKEQIVATLYQKEPVKRGKEGKTVTEGAVERVLKYHQVSRSPNEEVVSRMVKKQEDTLLAEVFKKAA